MTRRLSVFNIAEALTEDFSRPAALALAKYLDENWNEYDSALAFCLEYYGDEWKSELGIDEEEELGEEIDEELEELAFDHVAEKTSIIQFEGGIIVQNF